MSLYMFITEQDRIIFKSVSDKELNEDFQEALKYCPSLMIQEYTFCTSEMFKARKSETMYNIYHDVDYKRSPYQARFQSSGSGNKAIVRAYLHGIVNGNQNK